LPSICRRIGCLFLLVNVHFASKSKGRRCGWERELFLHAHPARTFRLQPLLNPIPLKFIDKSDGLWFFKSAFQQSHQNSHASCRTHYIWISSLHRDYYLSSPRRRVIRAENKIALTSSEAEQNVCIFISQSEVSIAAVLGHDYQESWG